MFRREQHEPGWDEGVAPGQCGHVWRDRAVTAVLGDRRAEVCDRCGALHFAGGGEPIEQPGPRHAAPHDLESLARRWSTGGASVE